MNWNFCLKLILLNWRISRKMRKTEQNKSVILFRPQDIIFTAFLRTYCKHLLRQNPNSIQKNSLWHSKVSFKLSNEEIHCKKFLMINVVIFNHRRKYTKPGTLALRIVKDKKIESCHTWRRRLYQIFNQKKKLTFKRRISNYQRKKNNNQKLASK